MPNSASNCITFDSSKNFAWFGIEGNPTKLFAKRLATGSSMTISITLLKADGSRSVASVATPNQNIWYSTPIDSTDCIAAFCGYSGSMGSGNVQFYLQ